MGEQSNQARRCGHLASIFFLLATFSVPPTFALGVGVRAGHISGRILDRTTNLPVSGLCVSAYSAHDLSTPAGDLGGPPGMGGSQPIGPADLYQLRGTVASSADGRYSLQGLQPDVYKIGFHGCVSGEDDRYFGRWFDDHKAYDFANATRVLVTPGGVDGIDVWVSRRTGIHGRVTDTLGRPVSGICVRPESRQANGPQSFVGSPIGHTEVDGTYFMPGPNDFGPSGSVFRVRFEHCGALINESESPYLTQWWPMSSTYEQGSAIHFREGSELQHIDAVLIEK